MISVKEFAFENKVSESIIYRHIRNHKEVLGENVQRQHGRTWLTDDGVSFIKGLMTQQTIVREKANDVVRGLERELRASQAEARAQAEIIKTLELKLIDFEDNKKLLEDGKEKINALEAQNADLSAEVEAQKGKIAEIEQNAQRELLEAHKELTEAHESFELDLQKKDAAHEQELQAEKERPITFKEYWQRRKKGKKDEKERNV